MITEKSPLAISNGSLEKENYMASTTSPNRVCQNSESQTIGSAGQPECEMERSVLCDLQCYAREYVQQQPEKAALICIGVGFILGWKLKPW